MHVVLIDGEPCTLEEVNPQHSSAAMLRKKIRMSASLVNDPGSSQFGISAVEISGTGVIDGQYHIQKFSGAQGVKVAAFVWDMRVVECQVVSDKIRAWPWGVVRLI